MPVDTTKNVPPTRRAQRKITDEELKDIEVKRIRGELSCAECRRLKLRCDKKVPCGSCCRRGCESICPCGILSAGQGTRFILADTEQLHRKISEMSNRIRQLEDALAILQSTISDQRHTLLSDDLLKIKFGAEALRSQRSSSPGDDQDNPRQSIDATGTLTLGESGEVKYFGRSAGSETLMMANEQLDKPDDNDEDTELSYPLPPELENLSNLFPFTSTTRTNVYSRDLLESLLPPQDRALSLCEGFLNHAAYFFRPLCREELMETLLPNVYASALLRRQSSQSPSNEARQGESEQRNSYTPHALATLFFLFALGALLDLNLRPYNAEAERYYDLGRAALSLRIVYDSPTVETVQAMGLMATYHSLAGKKYSRDSAWCVMSFAAKIAQSIGLHRDSARWQMEPKVVQKRRNLFWEVFAADVSHSLALGRPPAIHLSYVDCEFPVDEEATLSDSGDCQSGFWRMKHTFGRDIFNSVAEATLAAHSPSYTTVLNLDRKVREISFPASFKPYVTREDGEAQFYSSTLSLRGFYASQHRTVTMLYLHRSFFAQAMLDHPTNPLLSPFAPSFLTAYRCASVIIKASAHQFDRCEAMAMRIWFLLYHTFSAAVIVGTVVTRSPNSNIASSALLDLDLALSLFEKTAQQSSRARVALGVLRRLKEKAARSYAQFCSANGPNSAKNQVIAPHSSQYGIFSAQATDDIEDELAIFGGQTRVLDTKIRKHGVFDARLSQGPSSSHEDMKSHLNMTISEIPEVHPSLVEYLKRGSSRRAHARPSDPEQSGTSPTVGTEVLLARNMELDTGMRTSGSEIPSRGDMGEIYSSFMGYLASRSITNASPSSSRLSPAISQPHNTLSSDANSSGPVWKLSKFSQTQAQSKPYGWIASPSASSDAQMDSPSSYAGSHSSRGTANLSIGGSSGAVDLTPAVGVSGMAYEEVDLPSANEIDYMDTLQRSANHVGAMVEMGLTTESGMDAGWLSFMRDCGIMDNGRSS